MQNKHLEKTCMTPLQHQAWFRHRHLKDPCCAFSFGSLNVADLGMQARVFLGCRADWCRADCPKGRRPKTQGPQGRRAEGRQGRRAKGLKGSRAKLRQAIAKGRKHSPKDREVAGPLRRPTNAEGRRLPTMSKAKDTPRLKTEGQGRKATGREKTRAGRTPRVCKKSSKHREECFED